MNKKKVERIAVAELLRMYPRRLALYRDKGCSYWLADTNKLNCHFPLCFCYPEWQWKRREERQRAKEAPHSAEGTTRSPLPTGPSVEDSGA
jgi:hypothetical protein